MKLVSHERAAETARDDWETPGDFFHRFDVCFDFDMDVAASAKNALCEKYLGPGSPYGEDALNPDCFWGERNWCNPPFNQWTKFAERTLLEAQGGSTTVFLVPPRVDTVAYHRIISQASEHIMVQGRIQFLLDGKRPSKTNSAGKEVVSGNGAASMVCVFRPRVDGVVYGNPRLCFMQQGGQGR